MSAKALLFSVTVSTILPGLVSAEEKSKRRKWDQRKALEIVKGLIAKEDKGEFDWDKIAWQTDPKKAAALAKKEQKPVFVYFFLKKNVGPKAAPC